VCKGGYIFFPGFFFRLPREFYSETCPHRYWQEASKQASTQAAASKQKRTASKQTSKQGRKGGQQAGIIQPEINTLNLPEIDLEPSEMLKSILTKL